MDLTKILKPGMKIYSLIDGEVEITGISESEKYPICTSGERGSCSVYTKEGRIRYMIGECVLFPSKENHDWDSVTQLTFIRPKRGDYLISRDLQDDEDIDRVFIYNGRYNSFTEKYGCIAGVDYMKNLRILNCDNWTRFAYRYATEEEIEKFNERLLEEKGYVFNKQTNKLDFQGRVKRGEFYYYIGVDGTICQRVEESCDLDEDLYHLGNYFLTEKEAKDCLEKLKTVYKECRRWT